MPAIYGPGVLEEFGHACVYLQGGVEDTAAPVLSEGSGWWSNLAVASGPNERKESQKEGCRPPLAQIR